MTRAHARRANGLDHGTADDGVNDDVTLPEEMCDPRQLRTTVASPVWQPYRAPVQKGAATAQAPDT